MTRKVKAKVKIRRMKKVPFLVPIYKLYHNLFSRYGGADKVTWAMNANANGGLKISERKLVCQMTVVGRPSLQSSQIISLENVGKGGQAFGISSQYNIQWMQVKVISVH